MKAKYILSLAACMVFACDDLDEINENKNGVPADNVSPNLVLPTVLTEASKSVLNLGFGNIAGVVQHTQKDAWSDEHNDYNWNNQSWTEFYDILRNNKLVYNRAVETDLELYQGISLIMKSMIFGLVTDLWGDAPYSAALNGDQPGAENTFPKFDDQEDIYMGVIADLKAANELLSKDPGEYESIGDVDVIFGGDVTAWRRFANSLLLRYYMRISNKLPDVAKDGIEEIMGDPTQYPIITSPGQDATMSYVGNNPGDSWPSNTVYDASGSNYRRIKMASTFVDELQSLNDPRLDVWAKEIEIPLVVDAGLPPDTDKIEDGVRYLSPDRVAGLQIDTDPAYVGIPPSISAIPSAYNLNPTPGQQSFNPHVSYLDEIYTEASGDLLKARLMSASEVHFILAEAALKGWNVGGDAESHYNAGVQASFETWGLADDYAGYITQENVDFGEAASDAERLERIINQKWIASWTAATEAWFDYRRTGLPDLHAGESAKRGVLPVRFYYMQAELNLNVDNAMVAVDKLETTGFSQADGKNSAWSKPWLIQGTGKPW